MKVFQKSLHIKVLHLADEEKVLIWFYTLSFKSLWLIYTKLDDEVILRAILIDSIIELGLASIFGASWKAVPWSGDVLIIGNPNVMFTARSNPYNFRGINAWS